ARVVPRRPALAGARLQSRRLSSTPRGAVAADWGGGSAWFKARKRIAPAPGSSGAQRVRFKKPDTNGAAVPPENSVQPTVEGRCRAGVSTSGRRQAILAGTHGEIRVGTRMVKKLERL